MDKNINTLTEAWRQKVYGPFVTREGVVVNIVDKKRSAAGLTVYIGDNDVAYYPTGLCQSNGAYTAQDIINLSGTKKATKAKRIRSEARLLYYQRKFEEAQKDLRDYVRARYPKGSEVSFVRGDTYKSGEVLQVRTTELIVRDSESGLKKTVELRRLLGPRLKNTEN